MSRASYVRGRSTASLLDMSIGEFSRLNKTQLRQVVSRLSDTANKRMQSLQKTGVLSKALRDAEKSGGKFSTRGKGLDELRAEYMRVRDFLNDRSSTVRGAKAVEKDIIKKITDIYGEDLKGVDVRKLLSDFFDLQDYDEEFQAQKMRYGHLIDTTNMEAYNEGELNDIRRLSRRLTSLINRELAPGGKSYDGVSQWFDVDA
mgnify:CR=1 FL=1